MKNNLLKIAFIILAIVFIVPSAIYLLQNGTILGFNNYYNFLIENVNSKGLSSAIYLITFALLTAIYIYFISKKDVFKNIKQLLIFIGAVSTIFLIMLPWTSSDIFYYMGVGELDSEYKKNPYYISIREYCNENMDKVHDDEIIHQGYSNYWSGTTVIYGPVAQLIFRTLTKLSFKNIDVCLLLFKLVNLIAHLLNCYLIYKITKKIRFVALYGLNPYILLEFLGMVHNDIIVVFLILLSLYILLKKKKLLPSVVFLSLATGIKYFTVLLLPIYILYHYREERSIAKRFLKCIEYGLIFIVVFILEYAIYFRDMNIFTAMMVQNEKYSKSIYSGLIGLDQLAGINTVNIFEKTIAIGTISKILKNSILAIFAITYIKFCIDLLTTKEIKLNNALRKYNFELTIFIFALATFQQWYIIWLFATIFWQKPKTIKNIVVFSIATEFANSVYMFNSEHYKYDICFWGIILVLWMSTFGDGAKKVLAKVTNKVRREA